MRLRTLLVCSTVLALSVTAVGCSHQVNKLPPAKMLMEPGPGVGGPGPGVFLGAMQPEQFNPFGLSQIAFVGEAGMHVSFDVTGSGQFDSEPLIVPARQNFRQGAIYRLMLTNVPGHPGEEYYPTLEVGPVTPRTEAYIEHSAIPIQLTPEDFDQVQSGNFVTKVIYLPDPEHQKLALAAIETLVSTRLDPGVDPVKEADRRGSIMAILRLGNKDIGLPGTDGSVLMHGGIQQAGYSEYGGPMMGGPMMGGPMMGDGMMGGPYPAPGMSPTLVAGVNIPEYGMPFCGTPIGLPGPPHVPLGVPAGLERHTIRNKTKVHLPDPVRGMHIDVEQKPGFTYPKPPTRVSITEDASYDLEGAYKQPFYDKFEKVLPQGP